MKIPFRKASLLCTTASIAFFISQPVRTLATTLNGTISGKGASPGKDPYGLGQAAGSNFPSATIDDFVASLVYAILGFVGVIFLILIIWGGIMWMTAGGNEQRIDRAKKILIGATVGLIIILLGYSITYFVVESLTTANTLPSGGGLQTSG